MEELIKKIQELKDYELLNAYKQYGPHHSRHEAYAVLLEEVEEARFELERIKMGLNHVWCQIKSNDSEVFGLYPMLVDAVNLAAEAVQVAAMVQKFIDFEEGK